MSARTRAVIVNADDLGRTRGINEGIFEAHRRGLVTSATLMVGFEPAEEAAAAWTEHPELGVGLHVTLTGSRPLLPPSRVPTLVGRDGTFPSKPEGHGILDRDEVTAEIRAQLARFRELTGRLPTHFDSHHHSHRLPVVLEALITVARETGLPVRSPGGVGDRRLREADVPTTDAFVERFFGDDATLEVLEEILESLPPGVTEIMCHPARVDDTLREGSSYVEPRERELAVLTSPEARAAVRSRGIELTTFSRACGS